MASFRHASNQAEWQRPPQRTIYSHIAYLPSGVLHSAPLLMPSGQPAGEFESGLPRSVRPPPPPPRRGLSRAQTALSGTGQAHTSLSRGSSLQPAVHQAAGYYGAVPLSPQQQQQQWLLPVQAQNQPSLPFQGHRAWVQAAYGQPSYSQQQHTAVPQQLAQHQPALQQPGMAPQMPSAQYAHGRPQPRQQPCVQHVTQTAPHRVLSTQKSSLNGNARPFVGAKASASRSVVADLYSEVHGSDVSSLCSSRTRPSTSSSLQGAVTGRLEQQCRVDKQLNVSARAYIPQTSLKCNAQEDGQTTPQLHLHVAAQDSALALESGLQPEADVEHMDHLLIPELHASSSHPTPKQADQQSLCQQLLEQAPEQSQEQLPELAESSRGFEGVSPRLLSSADAEGVPAVAVAKARFASDDVVEPSLSTSTLTPAAAEPAPYVCIQKALARLIDDAPAPLPIIKAGVLNEGSLNGSAGSFTLGAHRGVTCHGQQASGSLGSDASYPQTDVATPLTAHGASAAVEAEPAVATAVDLADSDCSTEAAVDNTSAHSSGSPGSAAIDALLHIPGDTDTPTTAASSSDFHPLQPHASTAEAGSTFQPSLDASAGAAHASTGSDKLAARGAVSSGHTATAVAELPDSSRRISAALTSSSAASIPRAAPQAGITGLSSPSGSFLVVGEAQSEPSSTPGSSMGIGGAQSGLNSSTAPTAADTQLDDSRSMLCQAEDEPVAAAESVISHISSSGMLSQASTSAEDDVSSFTAAEGKGTGAVRASEEGSKSTLSDLPQGGVLDTPAQSANTPPVEVLSGREKSCKPTSNILPGGGGAHPPAVGSSVSAAAEQASAFAWEAAQLQSVAHATNADPATPVSASHGENTVQEPWISEGTEMQSVPKSQQQVSCSQRQYSSSVTHEGVLESIGNAQQSVEQQHTSSSTASEEARQATAAAAPVQPLQQSAAEEEERVPDAATARQQPRSTSKDEGDAAQHPVNEEEQQQQLPGRSTGRDAHHHASTDVEDCKVASNPSRQEEERIPLLSKTKVEGQLSEGSDPVRAEDRQGPSQLATGEDEEKIAASSPDREEEEQGLRQSAVQEDTQQTPPSSPLRDEDEQGFSQSASEAAEEERRPTDPSDGYLLLSPSSPEEEAAHQLQTNNAHDARLQAVDMSLRAESGRDKSDSSSQTKAKPGFLAKALFCSVAWPILVPVVAFSSCIQLYDACSMTEVLRYTV
ncbi:hypothetical protein WJX77_002523 [Trebouxia sp. C0004]